MNLKDKMDAAQKEYGGGNTDFFKFDKSGNYKMRLLSDVEAIATHFFGKGVPASVCYGKAEGCPFHKSEDDQPSVKFSAYMLDKRDGKVKLGEFPYSVVAAIGDLQASEDWGFSDYPMPYDITVIVDKEEKDFKKMYKVQPSPNRAAITGEQEDELKQKLAALPVEKYIASRKNKAMEGHKAAGIWVDEATRAANERERLAEGARVAAEHGLDKASGSEIKYPDEDINPEDIPF